MRGEGPSRDWSIYRVLPGVGSAAPVELFSVVWAPLGDLSVCESGDVGCVELLEFNRGAPAQGAVASLPIVEDLQVVKDRVGQLHTGLPSPRSSSSVCIRAQNDSMTALS